MKLQNFAVYVQLPRPKVPFAHCWFFRRRAPLNFGVSNYIVMKYTITIPEPCHENWQNMTPTAKGKFCGSCEKEVLDFSNDSMVSLSKALDSGSKLCGRFRPDQLNRSIRSSRGNAIRQHGVLVAAVALLTGVSPVLAQSPDPISIAIAPEAAVVGKIAVHHEQEARPIGKEFVTITGTVRSSLSLLTGVDVRIKESEITTKTGTDGKFEITVKASELNPFLILQVSYIDHQAREIEVHQADTQIDIDLLYDGFILGEMVIEEDPNFLDRVKKVFKKTGE